MQPIAALYVPLHRRTPSATSSPTSTARSLSPSPSTAVSGVYSPAELLSLSHSPLVATISASHLDALRAVAPEVVQTRKQRKALAWRARQLPPPASPSSLSPPSPSSLRTYGHRRAWSHTSHSSESEEDRAVSWRRS